MTCSLWGVLRKKLGAGKTVAWRFGSLCEDRPGEVEAVLALVCTMCIQKHTWSQQRSHAGHLTPTDFHVALKCADVEFDIYCVKNGSCKFPLASGLLVK